MISYNFFMSDIKKIAFIYPSMSGKQGKDALTPLIFAIVKPITPKNYEIVFYDERIEKLPDNIDSEIVVLSVETFSAKRAYLLADKYKKESKIVIMGGFHPTICPNEALEHSNAIVLGEIENIWQKILNDIQNNNLQKIYKEEELVDL